VFHLWLKSISYFVVQKKSLFVSFIPFCSISIFVSSVPFRGQLLFAHFAVKKIPSLQLFFKIFNFPKDFANSVTYRRFGNVLKLWLTVPSSLIIKLEYWNDEVSDKRGWERSLQAAEACEHKSGVRIHLDWWGERTREPLFRGHALRPPPKAPFRGARR
jgi:hypothetical protein